MTHDVDDLRIAAIKPLIPPAILLEQVPLSEQGKDAVFAGRQAIDDCLHGKDDRLVVVVGPCSIHDPQAAHEYANRLLEIRSTYEKDLLLVMRVYFEKPRTTVGWKGLLNDPHLDDSFKINEGLHLGRQLLVDIAEKGLPTGTEFLDTISPQFLADTIAWGAIGARTTESQIHRELASGLSMPIGFKNGTGGNVDLAVQACQASAGAHHFLSVTKQGLAAIVSTEGNTSCHLIMRGGKSGPNYSKEHLAAAQAACTKAGANPKLMVDCSHGNSNKDHTKQPAVAADLAAQIAAGDTNIFGVMIESHLHGGNQKIGPDMQYGVSITDACLAWEDTLPVLDTLAAAVRQRR